MNNFFIKRQTEFTVQLIALSLILFSTHSYLCYHFASEILFFFPLWHIYVFNIVLILTIFTLVNYRDSSAKNELFNLFILLPWLLSNPQQQGFDLANFFIPYFVFLTFEVYSVTKLLQKKNSIKKVEKQGQ